MNNFSARVPLLQPLPKSIQKLNESAQLTEPTGQTDQTFLDTQYLETSTSKASTQNGIYNSTSHGLQKERNNINNPNYGSIPHSLSGNKPTTDQNENDNTQESIFSFNSQPPSANGDPFPSSLKPPSIVLPESKREYWSYYIPAMIWMPQYSFKNLLGDIISGVSVASFQIPLSLSYASLAKVSPTNGLFAFAICPLVYSIFGSVPQMVIGPEAALSLMVGSVMKPYLHHEENNIPSWISPSIVVGIISGTTGIILLAAGFFRLGYLDSVFSRAFLSGFIAAVGGAIFVDQLIPELGLTKVAAQYQVSHSSTAQKLFFVLTHLDKIHYLTFIISFTCFVFLFTVRLLKRKLQSKYNFLVFIPEILITVAFYTILCAYLRWDKMGVTILGAMSVGKPDLEFPITPAKYSTLRQNFMPSILITVLGFCESTVAAKSLGSKFEISISTNRELVALGVSNFVGSLFCALPSFGGYGRSKINSLTGAKTQMSSIVLALLAIFSIIFLLPHFKYIPQCVLSTVISIVGLSLMEEAPQEAMFFYKIGGYSDVFLLSVIFFVTIFWSLEIGISIGVAYSLLRVLKHSTQPRIQILGRVPNTNYFRNADEIFTMHLPIEEIPGCLIVKIPEPLTFANTGDLKNRLNRLELYGSMRVHPSHPRTRHESSMQNVIFDLKGMTDCDATAIQILYEIIASYKKRHVRVFFSRFPPNPVIKRMWELSGIFSLVKNDDTPTLYSSIEDALSAIDAPARGIPLVTPSTLKRNGISVSSMATYTRNNYSVNSLS